MNKIQDICQLFYASHYLPIAGYANDKQLICCHALEKQLPIFHAAEPALLGSQQNPAVFTSESAGLYGCVRLEGASMCVLVGPVFSGQVSDEAVYGFMQKNVIPVVHKNEVAVFLSQLPRYTYNQFLNLLAFLHHSINGQTISVIDHFRITDPTPEREIAAKHTIRSAHAKEEQSEHGTYQFEMRILDYVRNGDVESLNALFGTVLKTQPMTEGVLAENPLRQAKNLLIGLVTMVGKAGAIEGGLDVEETYNLIDLYIQECEKAQSIEPIKMLQYNLVLDFADRVAHGKLPEELSREVAACIQFIKNHTNDHIGIDDVATAIGKSRAYTTRKFKAETGKTIGEYITESKVREACSLLRHSEMSISEISNYLFFASPPYFQKVFKQSTGTTPAVFRSGSSFNS